MSRSRALFKHWKYWSLFENASCSLSLALQIITAPGRASFYFFCLTASSRFYSDQKKRIISCWDFGKKKKHTKPTPKITSCIKSPNHLGLLFSFARHPWGCPLQRRGGFSGKQTPAHFAHSCLLQALVGLWCYSLQLESPFLAGGNNRNCASMGAGRSSHPTPGSPLEQVLTQGRAWPGSAPSSLEATGWEAQTPHPFPFS